MLDLTTVLQHILQSPLILNELRMKLRYSKRALLTLLHEGHVVNDQELILTIKNSPAILRKLCEGLQCSRRDLPKELLNFESSRPTYDLFDLPREILTLILQGLRIEDISALDVAISDISSRRIFLNCVRSIPFVCNDCYEDIALFFYWVHTRRLGLKAFNALYAREKSWNCFLQMFGRENLTRLEDFFTIAGDVPCSIIQHLTQHCSHLQMLEVQLLSSEYLKLLEVNSSIKSVSFRRHRGFLISAVVQRCPNLERLRIDCFDSIPDSFEKLPPLQLLRCLELLGHEIHFDLIREENMQRFLSIAPAIEVLHLRNCNFSQDLMHSIARACPHLTTLKDCSMRVSSLTIPESLSTLETFLKSCPQLTTYVVEWAEIHESDDLATFQNIMSSYGGSLRSLTMRFGNGFYSRLIPVILSNCHMLETLDICLDESDSDVSSESESEDWEDDGDGEWEQDAVMEQKSLVTFQEFFTSPAQSLIATLPTIVASNLREFRTSCCTFADIEYLVRQCKAIHTIECKADDTVPALAFFTLLEECPNLVTLEYNRLNILGCRTTCLLTCFCFASLLQVVRIGTCEPSLLCCLAPRCPGLKELSFSTRKGCVDFEVIGAFRQHCTRMEELTLNNIRRLQVRDLTFVVKAIPSLKGLCIYVPESWERRESAAANRIWSVCERAQREKVIAVNPNLYFEYQR